MTEFVHPRDKYRGHAVTADGLRYVDTDQLISDNVDRDCGHCELPNSPNGHDGCLGAQPGVVNACCGHGYDAHAYVNFTGAEWLYGRDALLWLNPEKIEAS